ncbi:E1-E2 ATPase-domain-containing protein [Xylaria digitata]|nr:E1-E2 ATPase-domain-containing protein [Xylaria digitata]
MGADCCGGKKTLPPAEAVRDSCDSSSVSECQKNTDCCTPNNEKCNKECLLSVAATLCTEEVGCHTDGHTDSHHDFTTGCSDKPKKSACDTHLQMAFEQYQSFLDNARCICRNMIERGYKSCCKTTEVEAKAQKPNAAVAGSSNCKASGKSCCAPKPTAGQEADACSTDGGQGQRQFPVGDTKKSGPGTCCNDVKDSQSRQQSDGRCGGKKQTGNCSSGKKQIDNCCSSKKQTDDYCSSKKQIDGCCSSNKQIDDCCSSKKQTNDCCSIKKQTDNCCSDKTKSEDTCAKQSLDNCCRPRQKKPGDDCCSKNQANGSREAKRASSCSTDGGSSVGCRDRCCEGKAKRTPNPFYSTEEQCLLVNPQIGNRNKSADVERGNDEAVRIGVTGMTCNGCSDNLARNLSANGACNIRVNYLQGHADFTMDSALNLETILAKTREATGFQITMMSGDESITVLTPDSQASAALAQIDFDGVKDVVVINKRTVRIHYNPTAVGARELFHNIEHLSVILAPPQNDQQLASGRKRFITLLVQTTASFIFTIPVLVLAWGETHVEEDTKAIISLVLGSLVQFLAVPVFYKPALKSLILNGALELDMLVVVAITAAFVYSVVAFGYLISGMPLETAAFFETSTLLISLVMLGRLVASYARIRAVASVSVRSLQASTAILVEDGVDREIDSRLLQFGDIFKVTPHSRVPTDGTIISGVSEVDESMVTGESLPVPKGPGASLVAGTTNGPGTLVVRLDRLPGKNTITDIAKLVEDASSSRPRVQEIADRVAGWFLPTVLTIAIVVFIIWTVVGLKVRNQTGGESVATAITYAVAVLAVSCPCGLGLAVPLVLVIANGIAARGGVIIKSADCTERSRKITDVVFDKTGTLTEPDLDVITEEFFDNDAANSRAITKALIGDSEHPVSVAIAKHLGPKTQPSPSVADVQSIPGAGIEGSMSSLIVRAGNANWTRSEALPEVRKMLDAGMSILVVMQDSTPIAAYGLQARLRPDAATTVVKLREDGINVHLVSGDQNKAVQAIAAAVGIDRANVASQQKPEEKQAYVARLMAQPGNVVMFCGDGMNDAVAVAQADIGVQLSNTISSEVTRSAANVVLLSGLSGIPFLIEVSRAAFVRTTFNFVWSAIYNVFAILLAAGAFVRVRIAPAYAGAGELVSILPVIIAALTMLLLKLRPN